MHRSAALLAVSLLAAACSSSSASPAEGAAAPTYAEPFTISALESERLGSYNSNFEHKGQLFADVDWKAAPVASVLLTVDLESPCYPFTKWKADAPPSGQNWPADCDAFDRNFSVYLDDAPPPSDAGVAADAAPPPPAYEVAHAITPFGGPEHLEIDLTDLANALPGKHRLRVDISSWSDGAGQSTGSNGSWIASAKLDVTPGPAPRKVLAAIPVLAASLGSDAQLPFSASFVAPEGTTHGRLEYRTSGHGGGSTAGDSDCIGPAEEFCHRAQTVEVDGTAVPAFDPWREDCADLCTETPTPSGTQTYCLENPCGAIQSVQAPRANWCPGSMTAPFAWTDADVAALGAPGAHTASIDVSKIAGGGSWLVSAIYYAYGD